MAATATTASESKVREWGRKKCICNWPECMALQARLRTLRPSDLAAGPVFVGGRPNSNRVTEFLRGCENNLDLGEDVYGAKKTLVGLGINGGIFVARHHFDRKLLERNEETNRYFTKCISVEEAKAYGITAPIDRYREYKFDGTGNAKKYLFSRKEGEYSVSDAFVQVPNARKEDIVEYVNSLRVSSEERGKRKTMERAHADGTPRSTTSVKKPKSSSSVCVEVAPAPATKPAQSRGGGSAVGRIPVTSTAPSVGVGAAEVVGLGRSHGRGKECSVPVAGNDLAATSSFGEAIAKFTPEEEKAGGDDLEGDTGLDLCLADDDIKPSCSVDHAGVDLFDGGTPLRSPTRNNASVLSRKKTTPPSSPKKTNGAASRHGTSSNADFFRVHPPLAKGPFTPSDDDDDGGLHDLIWFLG